MTDRLLIIGAGYTGLRLAARARTAGYDVIGTTRTPETADALRDAGAQARLWDVLDDEPDELADALGPDTAVVYSVPTLFDDPAKGRHLEPVAKLLTAARDHGCDRFVYLSSTSVYGDHGGEWVDEDSARRPTSPVGVMRRDIEDLVLEFDAVETNVVRIVGIYGPGRTLDRYIAGGRYELVDGGEKLTNRIHVDDLVETVLAVIDRGSPHRAYIASDGHPVRVVDLVDWLVENADVERPAEVTLEAYQNERGEDAAARWKNTYLARNTRIIELGVQLKYPTVLDGYRAIFSHQF